MARNYHQSKYIPKNPEKYVGDASNIFSRSSWEYKFMIWADTHPSVIKWNSEECIVPYISPVDNRPHRYFVDFTIMVKDTNGNIRKYLVEIKPKAQTLPPKKRKKTKQYLEELKTYAVNQAKWEAASKVCDRSGYTFMVLTEEHLGI